jgi:hypothetical protein
LAGLLVLILLLELFCLLDNEAAFLDFEVEMEILAFALLFLEQAFQSQVPIVGFMPSKKILPLNPLQLILRVHV